jgi:hypothetical protein
MYLVGEDGGVLAKAGLKVLLYFLTTCKLVPSQSFHSCQFFGATYTNHVTSEKAGGKHHRSHWLLTCRHTVLREPLAWMPMLGQKAAEQNILSFP